MLELEKRMQEEPFDVEVQYCDPDTCFVIPVSILLWECRVMKKSSRSFVKNKKDI